jgi:hypothetical protein
MMRRFGRLLLMNVVGRDFVYLFQTHHVHPGAKLLYLPPYSPDFNPIEQSFSFVKSWLRRQEAMAITPEVRQWLMHQAIMAITPEHAVGWAANCGYS